MPWPVDPSIAAVAVFLSHMVFPLPKPHQSLRPSCCHLCHMIYILPIPETIDEQIAWAGEVTLVCHCCHVVASIAVAIGDVGS